MSKIRDPHQANASALYNSTNNSRVKTGAFDQKKDTFDKAVDADQQPNDLLGKSLDKYEEVDVSDAMQAAALGLAKQSPRGAKGPSRSQRSEKPGDTSTGSFGTGQEKAPASNVNSNRTDPIGQKKVAAKKANSAKNSLREQAELLYVSTAPQKLENVYSVLLKEKADTLIGIHKGASWKRSPERGSHIMAVMMSRTA